MKLSSEPGIIVSGVAHAALLVATLVVFSDNRKFDDAQESIAVEVLTESQVNDITKGEKTAKEVKLQAPPRAEKVAEAEVKKPTPPLDEAKTDVPVPPPPLKRQADPGENDKPEPPKPAPALAAVPPPRPDPPKAEPEKIEPAPPPKPAPPKAEVKKDPEPPKPDAETIEPKATPVPPVKPRPRETADTQAKPKETVPPTPDELKKEFDKKLASLPQVPAPPTKVAEKPKEKPVAKPKSGDEDAPPQKKTDPLADAAKFLSKEKPQQTASTAKDLNRTASLGSPTQNAARMSPSLSAQLDGWMQDRYLQCWSQPITVPQGRKYIPIIQVSFRPDGSLAGQPSLVNPPSDPSWRAHAESAMRAVQKCNPMQIPPQFMPYYDQWKNRAVHFDRDEALG